MSAEPLHTPDFIGLTKVAPFSRRGFMTASAAVTFAQTIPQPRLTPQTGGTNQLLIAARPVDSRAIWAAGAGCTYVVTANGGET